MAPLVPMRDVGVDLLRSAAYARRVRDFESPLAGFLQAFPVVREGQVAAGTLKQQASSVVARRGLDCTLYQLAVQAAAGTLKQQAKSVSPAASRSALILSNEA